MAKQGMAGLVRAPRPSSRRQIVFVRTDRLGETLLNLPAIRALRQAYPDAHLTLILHPSLQELFVGHPDVDEVIPAPVSSGSWWRDAWRLSRLWRRWHPDVIVISNPKKAYHLGAWLAGIPCRVGWNRKGGWWLTHRLEDRKRLGERHEVEYNLDLVQTLGIPEAPPATPWLPVGDQEEQRISQLLGQWGVPASSQLLAVHPWTSNPRKQWPVDQFRALIQRLTQTGAIIVVIGGSEEQGQAAALMEGRPGTGRVVNGVGQCSLRELAALLKRMRVLISNDSGPMHLAAAVKTKTVALFGASDPAAGPRRWGPYGEDHVVIWKPSMDAITVEEVFAAVQHQLR
ncbi:MAG: glycosyltransferase family 9 protein [Candidatus Omnitrophica bacterium]|nr:glycosyltransferase family 9 protein [Candidatus Omnitrophota bacterium]